MGTWKTVANYFTPKTEKKFNEIHKCFRRIPNVYVDVSNSVIDKLYLSAERAPKWRFFKHLESRKLFAENVEERDYCGDTALILSAVLKLPKLAKALIEADVLVNAKDNYGFTALHCAAMGNCLEIGKMLIAAGANVNAEDHFRCTPLFWSNSWQHAEFTEMLEKEMSSN